jgi:hydrogenase maturation protease
MPKVMVIGYGNPLRTDDAIGWRAAGELSSQFSGDEIEIVACPQLNPEMAEAVAQAKLVVFIDACTDGTPGRVSRREVQASAFSPELMEHHLDPGSLLACAKELYGRAPKAVTICVTGECFGFGRELTPTVERVLPGVIELARGLVDGVIGKARKAAAK